MIAEEPDADDEAGVLNPEVPLAVAVLAITMFEFIRSAWDRAGVEKADVPVAEVNGLRIILFIPVAFDMLRMYEKIPIPSIVMGTISELFLPDLIYWS